MAESASLEANILVLQLTAFATSGTPRLTDGLPTTMVDSNGRTLAVPQRLTDFTFKVIYRGG